MKSFCGTTKGAEVEPVASVLPLLLAALLTAFAPTAKMATPTIVVNTRRPPTT